MNRLATAEFLTFTPTEQAALHALAHSLSRSLCVGVTADFYSPQDNDEYASLLMVEPDRLTLEPLATVQLIRRPARGFGLVMASGRAYGSATWRAAIAADFWLTLRYAERTAIRAALGLRAGSFALQHAMPPTPQLEAKVWRLSRAACTSPLLDR
ncbi:hypothetical protein [Methylibium rhizosphaerae]|uniref:hypothetical protein n=1 Tax=Methylibium rhizosphaerae TaxID=2570323 RepID=UPI00112AD4F5|nr:hypothetical protein [Methylibium rhizosphaerae]